MRHVESHNVAAFDFSGIQIRDLTAPLKTSSASVAHLRVPPGAVHAPARSHRCDKYYIGLSGTLRFQIGEQSVVLEPKALLVIEKGEWFAYANRGNETAEILLFHVPPFDLDAEEFATGEAIRERFRL